MDIPHKAARTFTQVSVIFRCYKAQKFSSLFHGEKMCLPIHVCIYLSTYLCMLVSIYTSIYSPINLYVFICLFLLIYPLPMYVYLFVHPCICQTNICTYLYLFYMYIYICKYVSMDISAITIYPYVSPLNTQLWQTIYPSFMCMPRKYPNRVVFYGAIYQCRK